MTNTCPHGLLSSLQEACTQSPTVSRSQVGQAVAATGAGYSQYATLKAASCFPIREATPEAVAVSLSGLTAAAALLARRQYTYFHSSPKQDLLLNLSIGLM